MVTAEECYSAKPLLKFSAYTDSQSQAVKDLGNEVLSLLTKVEIMSAYNRFWFWTLGAYEALRPMTDYLTCFDGPLGIEINRLKQKLAELRAPFAKQQLRGKNSKMGNEASVHGVGKDQKDMIFKIKGTMYSTSAIINEVNRFFDEISLSQVLAPMPE